MIPFQLMAFLPDELLILPLLKSIVESVLWFANFISSLVYSFLEMLQGLVYGRK